MATTNILGPAHDRNQDATVYVANLDGQCDEELLWEMFREVGPVVGVHLPKDRVSGEHQGYGFVEFKGEDDAEYAAKVMNMIKLFGKPIKVMPASQDRSKPGESGANLFIGNLDPDVDEKTLHDTFAAFGAIENCKIMREEATGASRGFGFVNFDSFEASDAAIAAMHNGWLMNRQISVNYAMKKGGERYGTEAERQPVSQTTKSGRPGLRPHTMFAEAAGGTILGSTPTSGPVAPFPPAPPGMMPQAMHHGLHHLPMGMGVPGVPGGAGFAGFPMGMPMFMPGMMPMGAPMFMPGMGMPGMPGMAPMGFPGAGMMMGGPAPTPPPPPPAAMGGVPTMMGGPAPTPPPPPPPAATGVPVPPPPHPTA